MKKFKKVDVIIQAVLLAIAIAVFLSDKGIAWWGKLNNEIIFSILLYRLPSFFINLWQLAGAFVHIRHPRYNFKKARYIYFVVWMLIIAGSIAYELLVDAFIAINFLTFTSLLIAIYYFIVCFMETRAIKKREGVANIST